MFKYLLAKQERTWFFLFLSTVFIHCSMHSSVGALKEKTNLKMENVPWSDLQQYSGTIVAYRAKDSCLDLSPKKRCKIGADNTTNYGYLVSFGCSNSDYTISRLIKKDAVPCGINLTLGSLPKNLIMRSITSTEADEILKKLNAGECEFEYDFRYPIADILNRVKNESAATATAAQAHNAASLSTDSLVTAAAPAQKKADRESIEIPGGPSIPRESISLSQGAIASASTAAAPAAQAQSSVHPLLLWAIPLNKTATPSKSCPIEASAIAAQAKSAASCATAAAPAEQKVKAEPVLPQGVTLTQNGNTYTYSSTSPIAQTFTGARGETITIGGGKTMVQNVNNAVFQQSVRNGNISIITIGY